MKCPKCGVEQKDGRLECSGCGVIFAKIRKRLPSLKGSASTAAVVEPDADAPFSLKTLLLPTPADPNEWILAGRAILLVVLAIWSIGFIFASIESNVVGQSFLHLVNLAFHEAGHIIFSPLGRFMQVLGGTLGQLLIPAICLGVLLLHTRDAFGAAVAQWWLAESFMDTAPYINDARALDWVLLGGVTGQEVAGYHDWEYLLGTLGLLRMDHALACLAQGTGIVLMVAALVWAAANVWVQYKALKAGRERSGRRFL